MKNATMIFLLLLVMYPQKNLSAQISKIDSTIEASAEKDKFSGSVLIAKNGNVIYEKITGYADNENKILNNELTSFSIASVGKIFTATLILHFVESGQLSLNEPVKKYLPGLSFPNIEKITIHQLLSHTSGLANYMNHPDYWQLLTKNLKIDDVIPLISEQSLVFDKPGLRHEYSNSGYVVLGKILENLTGKSYSEILSEQLLKPLAMTSTKFTVNRNNMKGSAIGYNRQSPQDAWESTLSDFPVPLSDGGIFTTCNDLLAFDQALFSGKIVRQETLKLMMKIHSEAEQPGFGKIRYGYGMMLDNFNGRAESAGHSGGSPGYNAEYRHYIKDDGSSYTVIILSNHERVIRPMFYEIQDMVLQNKI